MEIQELQNKTIVGIQEKYNDNDGAFSIAYYLNDDKSELLQCNFSNGYNSVKYDAVVVNASDADITIARQLYRIQKFNTTNYIGCYVILKGSRLAQNNVELYVVDYRQSEYNNFGTKTPEKITVPDINGKRVWVSTSCIKTITMGGYPSFF